MENFFIAVFLPWRLQPSNLNINFTHHDVVHVDIVHPDVIHCDVDVFRSKDSIFSSLNKELAPAVAWPKCRPRRRRISAYTANLDALFIFRYTGNLRRSLRKLTPFSLGIFDLSRRRRISAATLIRLAATPVLSSAALAFSMFDHQLSRLRIRLCSFLGSGPKAPSSR